MSRYPRRTRASVSAISSMAIVAVALAACGGGGGNAAAKVDLGSGPPKAGTVKRDALKGLTLTFVSYGGIYQKGQTEAAIGPFAKESGAKILQDGPTDNAKLKAQVESGNVTWDIVDSTNVFTAQQCGKLFLPLDKKIVDTSKIPPGGITDKCSVPAIGYGLIMVYNTKKYGSNPPTSWADFFNTTKYPGKRGLQGATGEVDSGLYEIALLADGVPANKVYPLNVQRALKKFSSIRKDAVFWSTGAQAQQQLESGQVDMSILWSGRAYSAAKNGAPFRPMWNQWMPEADTLAVLKGAKNPKAAFAGINYYLGAKQQAKLTELTSYSPVNVDAKPKVGPLLKSFLTSTPERSKDRFPLNIKYWAKHHDELVTAYTNWLAG